VIATAKLFSTRPSTLMAMEDPVLALAFDLAATQRALEMRDDGGNKGPVEKVFV
jgi:hypothetical protein